jgi:hypothetical protein
MAQKMPTQRTNLRQPELGALLQRRLRKRYMAADEISHARNENHRRPRRALHQQGQTSTDLTSEDLGRGLVHVADLDEGVRSVHERAELDDDTRLSFANCAKHT